MGARGGFFSKDMDGKKYANPKAHFLSVGKFGYSNIVNHMAVPMKIRRSAESKRGRPVGAAHKSTSTNFLSKSGHRIMQSEKGRFFINRDGMRVYGVKAHKRKVGSASPSSIANHMAVPSPVRRKRVAMKKMAKKNIMVFSPGGTLYKSFRSMMARKK